MYTISTSYPRIRLTCAAVKEQSGNVAASSKETFSGIRNARSDSKIAYSANPPGLAILFPDVADKAESEMNICQGSKTSRSYLPEAAQRLDRLHSTGPRQDSYRAYR